MRFPHGYDPAWAQQWQNARDAAWQQHRRTTPPACPICGHTGRWRTVGGNRRVCRCSPRSLLTDAQGSGADTHGRRS